MDKKTNTDDWTIKKSKNVDWYIDKRKPGSELMKNLAVAASLVLCAVTLKTGAVPGAENMTDAVVTAVTSDTLLDDQLGKLSFVSKLFPEATLVFGEQHEGDLVLPVISGTVIHAWNDQEPYLAWQAQDREVRSACDGTVMGVYHGTEEERIVQIMNDEGLVCVYGNLQEAHVQEGERIAAGESIGVLLQDQACVLEVSMNGQSVDPMRYMGNVQ